MKNLAILGTLLFGGAQARWHMGECPKLSKESVTELMPA